MDDGSQGQDAGVRQTPIWVDGLGRRRRSPDVADTIDPFPAVHDQQAAKADDGVAELRGMLESYIAKNDSRRIVGKGHSGTFGSGLSWNPNAEGAVGGAGGGDGDTGTADTPYVLGTNSTTIATPNLPQDDSWTRASGPSPAGGGPYDGVTSNEGTNTLLTRIWPDVSGTLTYDVDRTGGGTTTFTLVQYHRFARKAVVDTNGAFVSISAEVTDGIVTFTTAGP